MAVLFLFLLLICTAISSSTDDLKAKIFGRTETSSVVILKEKVLSGEQASCPTGQMWLDCAPSCVPTCDKPQFQICPKGPCIRGCFCAPPLLLRKDGVCVPIEQCQILPPCLPARCPRPFCPSDQTITPAGQCCPVCRGTSAAPLCPKGKQPLPNINCRTESCPIGSECVVDPLDAFAICCPTAPSGLVPSSNPVCDGEGQVCGGFFGTPCPKDLRCVDDPSDFCDPTKGGADCPGVCKCPGCPGEGQSCGGLLGTSCPADLHCVDSPDDDCDPLNGGADCIGVCQCPTITPCPMIKCPAPKEGCYYANRKKDKNGCVITCGQLKCDSPRCKLPMQWKECGECAPSCENPSPSCPEYCSNGCFCPPGLLKNGESCVTSDQCTVPV